MVWFKVDDALAFHPKTLRAGNAAMGLWVRAGSWSAQQLTDGLIPDSILPSLGTVKQAQALVAAGLWDRADGAWSFHEWNADGRQPTREAVEAERLAARERQRKHREQRESSRRDTTVTDGVTNAEVTGGVTPTPTRPDPTISSSSKKRDTATRGARLDPAWLPSPEDVTAIRAQCPDVDPQREHATFVDYWIAQPGQKGVKVDWSATWRNWMRRKQDDFTARGGKRSKDEQVVDVLEMGRRLQEQEDRKAIGS